MASSSTGFHSLANKSPLRLRTRTPLKATEIHKLRHAAQRKNGFRFLRFPPEIRHMVYKLVTAHDSDVTHSVEYLRDHFTKTFCFIRGRCNRTLWSLARVSKELYVEVLPYLYQDMKFTIHTAPFEKFFYTQPKMQFGMVQDLTIKLNANDPAWFDKFQQMMTASGFCEGMDNLSIELVKGDKMAEEDKRAFPDRWQALIREWGKLKLARRIELKISGRTRKRLEKELNEWEDARLAEMYKEPEDQ
ncbi:hypothetical protein KVT40_007667 [Elsinoe batatas]|uniref:Uncharacterized protein n=1 Tax=Elsinoe batatas TaxID=2601811 RepID=A0A8K0PAG9_9PEZI|nr:hypothetical protein KVT40_007667 [Elsinoe batatas]